MDWKAFLDKALEREKEWPAVWREELRAWRTQWQNVSTHVETIFKQSYRVLAILLIALLLANLLYPDNLYAKGFSSHHGGGDGISFTSMRSASPYRSHYRNAHWDRSRLFDQSGREYPRLLFTRPGQLVLTPLALSATLQLLEDASVAYATPVHGVVGHLTPGEFSLRTTRGEVLMNFGLDPFLQTDILKQVQSQQPVIKKARADHERWQEWIQWAKWTGPGRDASDDRVTLDRWSRLLDEAGEKWRVPTLAVTSAVPGIMLIPGIYVDVTAGTQAILILQKEGRFIHRPIPLPSSQNPFDLFLMNVLSQAASKPGGHDIQRYLPPPSSSRTQSW